MENRNSSAPTRKNRTEALQRLKIEMAFFYCQIQIWPYFKYFNIPGCVSKVMSNRWLHGHNYSSKFRTGNRWKRPQCPLKDEGTNRMWCTHTLECYTTLRKRTPVRCFSVDGPWGLWWEKWDSHKKTVLHDSSYASCLSRVLRWIEKQSRTVSAKGGKG